MFLMTQFRREKVVWSELIVRFCILSFCSVVRNILNVFPRGFYVSRITNSRKLLRVIAIKISLPIENTVLYMFLFVMTV